MTAAQLRARVEERAGQRCEYCHAPQPVSGYRFHIEHIMPRSRGGVNGLLNRALACATCNLAKARRMAGVDPRSGREVPLFNPRTQIWDEHFAWADDRQTILGRTVIGRATAETLDMNGALHRQARQLWFETGWLP